MISTSSETPTLPPLGSWRSKQGQGTNTKYSLTFPRNQVRPHSPDVAEEEDHKPDTQEEGVYHLEGADDGLEK